MFVIVMEVLIKMLFAIETVGILSGFIVGSRNIGVRNISHFLFADDTLIFCEANPNHLRYLRALFLCFKAISDLKINMAKS